MAKPPASGTETKPRRARLTSLLLSVGSLVGGVLVFVALASLKAPPPKQERPEKVYNVEVFDVERLPVQEILTGFGTAQADRVVLVPAQVAGEVVSVRSGLRVGQKVSGPSLTAEWVAHQIGAFLGSAEAPTAADLVAHAARSVAEWQQRRGDLLVVIDPEPFRERVVRIRNQIAEDIAELARLEQERINNQRLLAQARADVEAFRKEYERTRDLRRKNVATESELTQALLELRRYEQSLLQYENQRDLIPQRRQSILGRLKARRNDLKLAELDLLRTEVRAPFDGILAEVSAEQGQYVRTGDSLVRLVDPMVVEIPVPLRLADYHKLAEALRNGRPPRVELAANEIAPYRWEGIVERVAPEADALTRTANAYVIVDNREQSSPLLPGTFVHARIDGPVLHDALIIPRDAVVGDEVFVVHGDRAERRLVKVKRTLQAFALVEAGVRAGEAVILTNLDVLRDGARLAVQAHSSLLELLQEQEVPALRPLPPQTSAGDISGM